MKNLETKLGITFKNPELLKKALIHRSFINENRHEEGIEKVNLLCLQKK